LFDEQVNSVAALELDVFVDDRDWDLLLNPQSMNLQFVRQTFFVCGFQESRPEEFVDFNGTADYFARDFIVSHASEFNTEYTESTEFTEKNGKRSRSSRSENGLVEGKLIRANRSVGAREIQRARRRAR
jgi:hypothetical protein